MNGTPRPMKVTLVTYPQFPLETLWYVWMQSRDNKEHPMPEFVRNLLICDRNPNMEAKAAAEMEGWNRQDPWQPWHENFVRGFNDLIIKLFSEAVPVMDHIEFVFELENIPISLREQLVRHRIGVKHGPRIGMDIVPELGQFAAWSQSHRVIDCSRFVDDGYFFIPESVLARGIGSSEYDTYMLALNQVQDAYRDLVEMGIPQEDARNVIPLGAAHRTSWAVNLMALKHVIGKRSCWILQRGIWEGLIVQMVDELCSKVHPLFRALVTPPCIKPSKETGRWKWAGCPVSLSNEERVSGKEGAGLPPCPLWLNYHEQTALSASRGPEGTVWTPIEDDPENEGEVFNGWITRELRQEQMMRVEREAHERMWDRNVDTGAELQGNVELLPA